MLAGQSIPQEEDALGLGLVLGAREGLDPGGCEGLDPGAREGLGLGGREGSNHLVWREKGQSTASLRPMLPAPWCPVANCIV